MAQQMFVLATIVFGLYVYMDYEKKKYDHAKISFVLMIISLILSLIFS